MYAGHAERKVQIENTQEITWQMSYQHERQIHWNQVAQAMDSWSGLGGYYHQCLSKIYQYIIPSGKRVLEVGCGQGDLLSSLTPSLGVGIEFSSEMIFRAKKLHPNLRFILQDAQVLCLDEKFDYIILSDLVNDLWDVQCVLENLLPLTEPHTRIIINSFSRLWHLPLDYARKLGLANPNLIQNWLTIDDNATLLNLSGFEVIRTWQEVIFPFKIPMLNSIFNRFLVKIWPFRHLALTNFILARPKPNAVLPKEKALVSVVIPARNEEGNISKIFNCVPEMGRGTELIFVEGHSQDNTYARIEEQMAAHPGRSCLLLKQKGKGKGDAVRMGFEKASGEVLMILDADLTVPPETLSRFYEALVTGKGELINGVRLVYPMQKEAMRFINMLGNKFFSLAFSWLLGQPIKDTLCGTKVLWKRDYENISANRSYFGDFDPFGDFDLLFGADKLGLKIIDMPIRYHERTYGTTNIHRWKHGWLLLRMVIFAALRLKFV